MTRPTSRPSLRLKLVATTALASSVAGFAPAWGQQTFTPANPSIQLPVPGPTAPVIVGPGAGGAADGSAGALTVTLNARSSVIDWNGGFNIQNDTQNNINSSVTFARGSAADARLSVLNRDVSPGAPPSIINGALTSAADISVYILNTDGIVFGSSANVNVGALIASTLNIAASDFVDGVIADSLTFESAANSAATIEVNGSTLLTKVGGANLTLIAAKIDVDGGSITSENGNANFIAGTKVTIGNVNSPLGFTIDEGTEVANAVAVNATVRGKNITLGFIGPNGAMDAVLAAGQFTATTASASDGGIVLGVDGQAATITGGNLALQSLTGAKVSIAGALDGDAVGTRTLEVDTGGAISFAGSIGGTQALASVVVEGGGAATIGTGAPGQALGVTTTGDQTFSNPVILTADATLTGSNLTYTTITGDNTRSLALNFTGTTNVGAGLIQINNLSTGNNGPTTITGNVTTAGAQTYNDAVTLAANAVLTAGGAVSFNNTVDGARTLAVTTGATTSFAANVGGGAGTALTSLTVNGPGSTTLGTSGQAMAVTTSGAQTYGEPVTLAANTVLTGASVSYVSIAGGGNDLGLNFSGTTNVGPTLTGIRNLSTGGTGTTTITGDVTTTGDQSYEASSLSGNAVLTGANLSYVSIAGNGNDLGLNFTGTTNVGPTLTGVRNLSTGNTGTTTITGNVTTTGDQSYEASTLTANAVLTGVNLSYASIAGGGNDLGLNFSGTTNIGPALSGVRNLSTGGGGATTIVGNVTTSGDQSYEASTLTANAVLTGVNLSYASIAGNGNDLGLNFSGATNVGPALAGVRNLSTGGGGATTITGNVATTGTQSYETVALTGDAVLAAVGGVTFNSTVNGARALTVNTTGETSFFGDVGAITPLTTLTTDSAGAAVFGKDLPGGAIGVTTTDVQNYNDPITLAANTTFASAKAINFNNTIDGAYALTVNTPDVTSFNGAVGAATPLGSITTDFVATDTTVIATAAINTQLVEGANAQTGDQNFKDAVTLNADTTLTSNNGGAISFQKTVDGKAAGEQSLTVNTAGVTSFAGKVGSNKALEALITNATGKTEITGGLVRTMNGKQSFGDAVTLKADTTFETLTAGDISFAALDGDSAATRRALTVTSAGKASFNGAVGGATDKRLSTIGVTAKNDVEIFSTITAQDAITIVSTTEDILFCGNTCSVTAGGALKLSAALKIDGKTASGGEVGADAVIGGASNTGDLTVSSDGNLRIGTATSTNGDVLLTAAGSISGIPVVSPVIGAGDLTGKSVTAVATGGVARFDDVTATAGGVNITGTSVAVNTATATTNVALTATAGGIYAGAVSAPTLTLVGTAGAIDKAELVNGPANFGRTIIIAGQSVTVDAAQGYAQLKTVTAGTDITVKSATGLFADQATATAGAIDLYTANGLLSLGVETAAEAPFETPFAGVSTAGTTVRLRKLGETSELRAGTVESGKAATVQGDVTIFSATNARLFDVTAVGGDLTVRSGVDFAFDPAQPVVEARAGAVTGLKSGSTGLDDDYGRAVLTASARDIGGVAGGAIFIDAGTLVQLGTATADKRITIDAGTKGIAGRDGAIDVTQALSFDADGLPIAASDQGLFFTAYNDPTSTTPAGILLGTAQANGMTVIDPGALDGATTLRSESNGAVTFTTTGRGDIAIGAGLLATHVDPAGDSLDGAILIASADSVLLRGKNVAAGVLTARPVESRDGRITITAARSVTGFPASSSDDAPGADVVIRAVTADDDVLVDVASDLRIGSATSITGDVQLEVAGAVSGLGAELDLTGAGDIIGRNVVVTAGDIARVDSITANGAPAASGNIDVTADAIAIALADASGAVTLTAGAGGLYAGRIDADLGATLTSSRSGSLDQRLLQRPDAVDTIGTEFGFADLTATAGNVFVHNQDGIAPLGGYAQLGVVRAGQNVTVAASTGAVINQAVATTGALDVFTADGLLSLGVDAAGAMALPDPSTAGTTVRLRKLGETSELRAGRVESGKAATVQGDVTILSATNARLFDVTATGGDLTVRSGVDFAFGFNDTTEVRKGAVTGLKAGSNGIDPVYGRAVLKATTNPVDDSPAGGTILVDAGTIVQLGAVGATKQLTIEAGTSGITGRDGAIDVTKATVGEALLFTAFNGATSGETGIRLGTKDVGGKAFADALALQSKVGADATFITTGDAGGDVTRSFVAINDLDATGTIRVDSVGAAGLQTLNAGVDILVTAVGKVTALPVPSDEDGRRYDGLIRIGSLTSEGDLTVDGGGDVRFVQAISNAGQLLIDAAGSITGLALTGDPGDAVTGGIWTAGQDVTVQAGPLAQIASIDAGRNIAVGAGIVAVGFADAGGFLSLTGVSGVHLGKGVAGSTALVRTITGAILDPVLAQAASKVDANFAFATLAQADAAGKFATLTAGRAIQVATVKAGQTVTATSDSYGLSVTTATARDGALLLTSTNDGPPVGEVNPLYLVTGSAGTEARLVKRGTSGIEGDELRAASLTSGTAGGVGRVRIFSSTDARLGTVVAQGGDLTVRAGVDTDLMSFETTEQRAGAVTGLLGSSTAANRAYGRAVLTALGDAIEVDAGTLAQLGAVTAGKQVKVDAGTDGIAGRDGAIDVSSVAAASLSFTAFNAATTGETGVRLGTTDAGGKAFADAGALQSIVGGNAFFETKGNADPTRSFVAINDLDAGAIDVISVSAAGLQTLKAGGDITVTAAGKVTGLPVPSDETGAGYAGRVQIGKLVSDLDLRVNGATDVRFDEIKSTRGNVAVTAAAGSITGFDGERGVTGGDWEATGGSVSVTAGPLAQISSIKAAGSIGVGAGIVAVGSASAGGALALTGDSGVHLGEGKAGLTATITTSAGTVSTPLLAEATDTVDANFAFAALAQAVADNTKVTLTAGRAIQVDTVSAGATNALSADLQQVQATGDSVSIKTATATNGALLLTSRAGPLYLATGSAGARARLAKQGVLDVPGDEMRITRLTAGNAREATGTIDLISATNVRANTITARGGAITIDAGADTADIAARAGSVTGRLGASDAIDQTYGRTTLTAGLKLDANGAGVAGSDQAVTVRAGNLVQLGAVKAGTNILVTAGTDSKAGDLAARDGAIDATSVTTPRGQLAFTAFNDATGGFAGIRLGTVDSAAGPASDQAEATVDSTVFGLAGKDGALFQTLGTQGDIAIGRSLEVTQGDIRFASVKNALFGADPYLVEAKAGSIFVTAGDRVDGLPAGGSFTGQATVGESGQLRAGQLTAGGLAQLTSNGDVRIGTVQSAAGDVLARVGTIGPNGVFSANTQAGSVTGLLNSDSAARIDGAGQFKAARIDGAGQFKASGSVKIDALNLVRVTTAMAGTSVEVGASTRPGIAAIEGATAGGGLLINAVTGLHLGSGTAGATATLNTTSSAAQPRVPVAAAGGANLIASKANVTVEAGALAQLGTVTAAGVVDVRSNAVELLGQMTATKATLLNRPEVNNATTLGGDPAVASDYALTDAEIDRIAAATVTFDAVAQNVVVRDASLAAATGSTLLNVFTTGDLTIFGAFKEQVANPNRTVQLGGSATNSASLARAIIATSETGGATIGSLDFTSAALNLDGENIAFGRRDFVGEVLIGVTGASPIDVATASKNFESNTESKLYKSTGGFAPASGQVYLRANRLNVRYGGFAFFQNSATPSPNPELSSAGAVIGVEPPVGSPRAPNTLVLNPRGTANSFALFGSVAGKSGAPAAVLGPVINPTNSADLTRSRINGCLIGSPSGCLLVNAVTPNIFIFDQQLSILSAADLLITFDPVIGANNEVLFSDLGTVGFPDEEDPCDPNDAECRNREDNQ